MQTFGPKDVRDERGLQRYEYYAEALGTDGRSYYATGRSRPTSDVSRQEECRQMTREILECQMRLKEVWGERSD